MKSISKSETVSDGAPVCNPLRLRSVVQGLIALTVATASVPGWAGPDNPYAGGTRLGGPPPAEFPDTPSMSDQNNLRITLDRFAQCIIKSRRTGVMRNLALAPWDKAAIDGMSSLTDEDCLYSGQLTFSTDLLRGAFFNELYREQYGHVVPQLASSPVDFRQGASPPFDADISQAVALREFGDCVVRKDFADSHAYVLASPGSVSESRSMAALSSSFGPCLPQGTTVHLNKMLVKAVLAETAYRNVAPPAAIRKP